MWNFPAEKTADPTDQQSIENREQSPQIVYEQNRTEFPQTIDDL